MDKFVIVDYQNFFPLTEAFERLGYRVLSSWDRAGDEGLAGCELALFCMFKSIKRPLQSWSQTRRLNRAGVPVITWNRDGPSHKGDKAWRLWLLRNYRYFNIYATHTLQDSIGFAPQVVYLPNAAWDTEYHLGERSLEDLRNPRSYKFDVSFFGRIAADRFPEMKKRDVFFRALASRLSSLGLTYLFEEGPLTYPEQRALIQSSRINLSFHAGCDDNYHGGNEAGREKSWGMPERCFGVPACGGFLLSDSRKHAVDNFEPGSEWIDFADLDDCVRKIQSYVANFKASRRIAEAAYHRVRREHLYLHRAHTLLAEAKAWRDRHALKEAA